MVRCLAAIVLYVALETDLACLCFLVCVTGSGEGQSVQDPQAASQTALDTSPGEAPEMEQCKRGCWLSIVIGP